MRVRLHHDVPGVASKGDVVQMPEDNRSYSLLKGIAVRLPPRTPVTVELSAA